VVAEKPARATAADSIDRLRARYLELFESAENKRRLKRTGVSWTILPEFPLLASVTGASLRAAYLEPDSFVRFTLAQRIYRFERWRDCTPLSLDISYWPGVILETSVFGMEAEYPASQDPWVVQRPIVSSPGDIRGLRASFDPDRGIVKLVLEMSEFCRRALPEFTVHVQAWDRSPFGIATDLVGSEELLVKAIIEPSFVHELMKRIVDEDGAWSRSRNAFLKRAGFPVESSISPGTGSTSAMSSASVNIIADEVNMPMMSPSVYEDLVFPYDRELVQRAGGLNYYHSCGCLTPFLPSIATLRPVTQHVSAWTDWATAVRTYAGTNTLLQKTLHPMRDVLDRDADGMAEVIRGIKKTAGDRVSWCLIANGIDNACGDMEKSLSTCDEWVVVAAACLS
jgi:hypothetical protein